MVIAFHSTFYVQSDNSLTAALVSIANRMWLGVPIFFVISGYCISATADNSRRKKHPTLTYFKRRFRRIFPPYWIAFAGFAVLVGILDVVVPHLFSDGNHEIIRPLWLSPRQWITNLSLTESWLGTSSEEHNTFWGMCGRSAMRNSFTP